MHLILLIDVEGLGGGFIYLCGGWGGSERALAESEGTSDLANKFASHVAKLRPRPISFNIIAELAERTEKESLCTCT